MRRRWIRERPGTEEDRKAGAAALATLGLGALASAVVFYVSRILFARRRIDRPGEVRPLERVGGGKAAATPETSSGGGAAARGSGASGGSGRGEEAIGTGRERR